MKQLIKYFVLTIAAVLVLTACQNKSEDGNNKSDSSSGSKDKLVLYAAGPDDLVKDMVKEFEKKVAKSRSLSRTTGEILGRLEAEKDNPKADVVQLASLPAALDYKKKA